MNELKVGTAIVLGGSPYEITYASHLKMGRGGAVVRTKLRSLADGSTLEKTFAPADKIEEADLMRRRAHFLYEQNGDFLFMDEENFEQYELKADTIGKKRSYLKDGQAVDALLVNDRAVSVEIPKKITLKVTSAPPGVRGDTSGTATKTVTLETGLEIRVPLFIKSGDEIRINTETGEYVERA